MHTLITGTEVCELFSACTQRPVEKLNLPSVIISIQQPLNVTKGRCHFFHALFFLSFFEISSSPIWSDLAPHERPVVLPLLLQRRHRHLYRHPSDQPHRETRFFIQNHHFRGVQHCSLRLPHKEARLVWSWMESATLPFCSNRRNHFRYCSSLPYERNFPSFVVSGWAPYFRGSWIKSISASSCNIEA